MPLQTSPPPLPHTQRENVCVLCVCVRRIYFQFTQSLYAHILFLSTSLLSQSPSLFLTFFPLLPQLSVANHLMTERDAATLLAKAERRLTRVRWSKALCLPIDPVSFIEHLPHLSHLSFFSLSCCSFISIISWTLFLFLTSYLSFT